MIREKQGHPELARKEYETALTLDPDNEEAKESLRKLSKRK